MWSAVAQTLAETRHDGSAVVPAYLLAQGTARPTHDTELLGPFPGVSGNNGGVCSVSGRSPVILSADHADAFRVFRGP